MWRVKYLLQYAVTDLLAAAVFIIPLFLILGKFRFKSAKLTALYTLFALYLTAALSIVGFPAVTALTFDPGVNVIPIVGMIEEPAEALLNVLLFLPLGFFLPILWEKFRSPLETVIFGFCVSLFVELSQLFTFRVSDINDLIANTAGAVIGYLIATAATKKFTRFAVKKSKVGDCFVIFGAVMAITFALAPLIKKVIFSAVGE